MRRLAGVAGRDGAWHGDRARDQAATPWLSYVAVIVAAILWGSLYPAGKPAVAHVGAVQVVFCRALLASLTLGVVALVRGGGRGLGETARGRWLGIATLALLSFSGSSVLAMLALRVLPASVNGLLNNTHPLWIALGTAWFYPPRRPGVLIGGSLVALVGVALVFFPDLSLASLTSSMDREATRWETLDPIGVALSLAGSGVIAASTVTGRRVMRQGDPIAITALASGAAVPPLLLLTLLSGGVEPILSASLADKLLLLYVGIGCTAVNFTLWFYALQRLPAAQASAFQYLIPPIGVVISSLALSEPITAGLALGGTLILIGLVATQIASSGPVRARAPRAPA